MNFKILLFFLFLPAVVVAMEESNQSTQLFTEIKKSAEVRPFAGLIVAYTSSQTTEYDAYITSTRDRFGYINKMPEQCGGYILNRFITDSKASDSALYVSQCVYFFKLRHATKQELKELYELAQRTDKFGNVLMLCKRLGKKSDKISTQFLDTIVKQMTS